MILPIVAYGSPVLRTVCEDIGADYPNLDKLIADMWETMYNSNGVGLAAPQVNVPIRLFVIDSEQIFANKEDYLRQYQQDWMPWLEQMRSTWHAPTPDLLEPIFDAMERTLGGSGALTAVTLARLGVRAREDLPLFREARLEAHLEEPTVVVVVVLRPVEQRPEGARGDRDGARRVERLHDQRPHPRAHSAGHGLEALDALGVRRWARCARCPCARR